MKQQSLTNSYLSSFCLELSMLLQAGVTLSDGVLMLKDDEPGQDGKEVAQSLLNELEKGAPLSTALRQSPYFPGYMVNMVDAGEKTGRLAETLTALSQHYERQDRIAVAVKNAVMYPAILLIMMIAVVMILIIQVLPIFNDVFSRLGAQMPPLAARLMQFGGWLSGLSIIIAAICGLIFIIMLLAWLIPKIRQAITTSFINRWGSRGVWGKIAASRFTSVLTMGIASGLNTEEAVKMAAAINSGVKELDQKYAACVQQLRNGSSLAESMRNTGILSARNSRILALGAKSGMTDAAMAEIAIRDERVAQDGIDSIVSRIEPTLVIITSVIIGVILLSVMLPLMGIMTSIG